MPELSGSHPQHPLPVAEELAAVARLALPLAAVQLGNHLMGAVDAAIAGRISDRALAGTGLGTSVFFAFSVVGIGVVLGLDPIAAQAFGAGRSRLARRSMWQGLYVALLVTAPLSLLVMALAFLLERCGVEPATASAARTYVLWRLPSLYFLLATIALRSYLQAAQVARPVLLATVAASVANLVFGVVLGLGDRGLIGAGLPPLGLPPLGVVGLGLAATVATIGQLVILALAVRAVPAGEGAEALVPWDGPLVRDILKLGAPVGLMMAAEVGVFSLAQVLIGGMSVSSSAAHQVAITFASLSFSVCLGIGGATSVRVGRAIGRGDAPATRRAGLSGIGLGAAFMAASGLVLATIPERLVGLLTHDAAVIPTAVLLLRVAAVFQLFDGIQAVSSGALRGAGVTRWAFGANLVAHWGIGLPIGLTLAFWAHRGVTGLWWGLVAGLAVIAFALAGKFIAVSRQAPVAVLEPACPEL